MQINVDNIINQLFERLKERILRGNRSNLYNEIGVLLIEESGKNFDRLGSYFSASQWAELSTAYKEKLASEGKDPRPTLRRTRNLERSFDYEVTGETVGLINTASYARFLHKGTDNMDARPLFPERLPEATRIEIEGMVKDWLLRSL